MNVAKIFRVHQEQTIKRKQNPAVFFRSLYNKNGISRHCC